MAAGLLVLRPRTPTRSLAEFLWQPSACRLFGYLLPAVFLTLFIIVYPIAVAFDLSFRRVRIMSVGAANLPLTFGNYRRLARSTDFWNACVVSLAFVVIITAGCFIIGLGIALLVNQRLMRQRAARLLVALPWAMPEVVKATTWAWIFDGSFGVVNWALRELGIVSEQIAWLSQPHPAFAVVTVVMIWTTYPFVAIMLQAGLQAIPNELFEAARVDCATARQRLWFVTLPCLRPGCGIAAGTRGPEDLPRVRHLSRNDLRWPGRRHVQPRSADLRAGPQLLQYRHATAIGVVTLIFCCTVSTAIVRRSIADQSTGGRP